MNNFRGHHRLPSVVNVSEEWPRDECDRYPQYSKYPTPPPGNRHKSNSDRDRPGSSSQNWHREEQEAEHDPDPELVRKCKELQAIQEKIVLKRASLALKTVDFKTVNPQICTKEARPTQSSKTLRDRVKLILIQRKRMFAPKEPVAKTRRCSINIPHNHPLRHRVHVALEQRFMMNPPMEAQHFEQIGFFRASQSPQIDNSPVEEEEKGNQGFMRFLNILNKGVDIDKLKEMVTNDTDSTPQSLQTLHNSQNGLEKHGESSSFSSPPVEMTASKKEQQMPNPREQQKHLQHILESLGLSLDTDEMRKMADRTQERLYGKRLRTEEEEITESGSEDQFKKGEEKYSPAHYTRSSSSSSTSSSQSDQSGPSTQSPSRSPSRSPHCHRRSRSPYRQRSRDLRDPLLQFQPPAQPSAQPSAYPPPSYFNTHFPPQIYPDPYTQYAAYYNYWANNQFPGPGSINSSNQNYPQTISDIFRDQQFTPNNGRSNHKPSGKRKSKSRKSFLEMDKGSDRYLVSIQQAPKDELSKSKSKSVTSEGPFITVVKRQRKWKKKKKRVFVERNEEMEKLLNNRSGPVTRSLAQKNPEKLEYNGKLVEIEDVPELNDDAPLNAPMRWTVLQTENAEPKNKEKPMFTEEDFKANLKLKLEAFNSRMKKTEKPAQSSTLDNVK